MKAIVPIVTSLLILLVLGACARETSTPYPTYTLPPTYTPQPTYTPYLTPTLEPTATPIPGPTPVSVDDACPHNRLLFGHVSTVLKKYRSLFRRQPNYHGFGMRGLEDEKGNQTTVLGIVVRVTEKVDQSTLPPEDRIPACLEGVPVQIVEEPKHRSLPSK